MANNSKKPNTGNREQRFAIASSEYYGSRLGPTRIRKANIKPLDQGLDDCSNDKRPKRPNLNKAKKQPEMPFSRKSLKIKFSNTSATNNVNATADVAPAAEMEDATNIKKFLELRLLDHVEVTCYKHNPKRRKPTDIGTHGQIFGSMIECLCKDCHRNIRYTTTKFEAHALCKKKHPAENFYIRDGLTVRDVMNACKISPRKCWGSIVRKLVGVLPASKSLSVCSSCKGSFLNECNDVETTLCSLCLSSEESARSMTNISSSTSCDGVSSSRPSHEQIISCSQCEKNYPFSYLEEPDIMDPEKFPKDKWLCSAECKNIQSALQQLIESGEISLPQYLIQHLLNKQMGEKAVPKNIDATWRLLQRNISDGETKNLLSKANHIFHERFDKIKDGKGHDLISRMVYGKSCCDINFEGMYCAILSVTSTVVCAAIIRIFGDEVAELPLVAIQTKSQGKGYFHALFSCIQDFLESLNVKKFVLPAAKEAESMWISKFGFHQVTEDELSTYNNNYPIMMFEGSSMLHKLIVHQTE